MCPHYLCVCVCMCVLIHSSSADESSPNIPAVLRQY
uniref:Uncharacterized protein n=1 Tax=Anguilla anguilla TaxID=7936 RepID=A0A0E9SKB0_ANGAN